ncbi:hypothetical protein F3Y22_tig00001731pilonHSYRG00063 [Hibiscus syriacus]|uniref:Pectinesterase n=1 Tax=Hibiscus syriacus TaxID=106335 RepID=A0A6A3CU21_HIBSY|nr:hypothetical protein F3Y22_tig00001731pilonHSYRG00063 [Hibiscus syriacus]
MAGPEEDAQGSKRIAIIAVSSCLLVAMVVAVTASSSKKAIELICEPTKFKGTCEEQVTEEAGNKTDVKDLKMKKFLNITMQLSRNGLAIACELEDQLRQFEDAGLLPVVDYFKAIPIGLRLEKETGIDVDYSKMRMDFRTFRLDFFREKNENWNRRRLLQDEDGLPVLGHSDWTSFRERMRTGIDVDYSKMRMDFRSRTFRLDFDIPIGLRLERRMRTGIDVDYSKMRRLPVLGHSDWTSFREKNEGWNRRLLLEEIEERIPQMLGDSLLVGDGKENTRITGSISTGPDGNPTTYFTATFAVDGNNFIAKNIAFENTAGPLKAQAVAVRVQSEDSVFFNCSIDGYQDTLYAFTKRQFYRDCTISGTIDFVFDGYQDTLYAFTKRQFYRDCTISGTIDFVFGDASVIFQNCTFLVRKPEFGHQNVITASKRTDDKEPTGIVIHGGQILPAPELAPVKYKFPVYLGRPWGSLSTAVIMETYIDDMVHPEGWTSWESSSAAQTCTYLEFNNRGPGASTNKRVKWPGVMILSEKEAANFLPPKFFAIGDDWIKETGVPYSATFDVKEAEREKPAVDLEKQKLGQEMEKEK